MKPNNSSMTRGKEAGQALVLAAMGLTLFILAAGLGIDMGFLRYQKRLQQSAADSAAIAGAAADSLSAAFEMAGVSLRTDLTPVCIMCDYDRIREVIANLLTNALKYTSSGGEVTVETWPSEPWRALVRVTDTGIGIPPDELPHVTERFFRGRRAAEYAAGSGFGLTIVSELVRAHAGSITIASEPGRGTEVTVILPRAAAA